MEMLFTVASRGTTAEARTDMAAACASTPRGCSTLLGVPPEKKFAQKQRQPSTDKPFKGKSIELQFVWNLFAVMQENADHAPCYFSAVIVILIELTFDVSKAG